MHSLPIYFKNSPAIHLLKDLIPDKDKIFLVILYIQIQNDYIGFYSGSHTLRALNLQIFMPIPYYNIGILLYILMYYFEPEPIYSIVDYASTS